MTKRVVLLGLTALLAGGVAASLPAIAQAAGTADVILIRQAGQSLLGAAFGGLKTAIDAKVDVKPLAARADAMVKWAKVFPLQFPEGSDTGAPTKALPAIWTDRAGFEKADANFVESLEKLSVLAKAGDSDGFAAQWKVVGDACGACHKDYRAK